MALRVLHTVHRLHPDAGGPSRTVCAACTHLAARGIEVEIVAGRTTPDAPALTPEGAAVTFATGSGPRGLWRFAQRLRRRVQQMQPHVIHDHGVWLSTNALSAVVARRAGIPWVTTPRGMLEPWALQHRRWKKKVAWHTYQRRCLQQAAFVQATARMEARHLRALNLTAPIAVIPNGVSPPASWPDPAPRTGRRRALFLSRIHPKKGLPMLIDAWAAVQPDGWELVIAGPDEGRHRRNVEARVEQHGLADQVRFIGPVDDREKWAWYRSSDLFVLPTHSENFGVVVAEALLAQVPVLTTTGAPWEVLETGRCGWWVDPTEAAIAEGLETAVSCSEAERAAMGRRGHALVNDRYTWTAVARLLHVAYEWVDGGEVVPPFVVSANANSNLHARGTIA